MPRKAISAPNGISIGPYSHAVESDNLVYLSGQGGVDPQTGTLVDGGVQAEARQTFKNLFAILAAAGLTPGDVVKVNVYLANIDDFAAMNAVYATQFDAPYPARTTIGVAALPLSARVEIEMIAKKNITEG
ncbi:MAG: RidA family protein [Chloroflexota bacterium]|nr:MAG: RidA family protein [Chloroflexota bacterium]